MIEYKKRDGGGILISQKATILCLYEILKKYSDEEHIISADKIRERLKIIYDVDMERRAIYRNIDALRSMGIEIEGYTDNREGYYLIDREFECAEIRLLCDAIAASEMVNEEQGKEIIKKLIQTQSIFQGRMFQKTVYVKPEEVRTHRNVFYSIDTLNIAINQGCKVSIKVLQYSINNEQEMGETIIISPYATVWAKGNYYIIGKRDDTEELTHFCIDRIKDILILEYGIDMIFGGFNPTQYVQKYIYQRGEDFGYFEIKCKENLWESIVRQFDGSVILQSRQNDEFYARIKTIKSDMKIFVLNHLSECEVVKPQSFREEIQLEVMEAYKKYWK